MSNKTDIGIARQSQAAIPPNPELIKGDVVVNNKDLVLVKDLDRVIQQVIISLKFFKGEWGLDTTYGIPYYEDILEKNPDLVLVTSDITQAILSVEEVTEVTDVLLEYDPIRILTLSCMIHTPYGRFPLNEALGDL